jgi:hypothetical protein
VFSELNVGVHVDAGISVEACAQLKGKLKEGRRGGEELEREKEGAVSVSRKKEEYSRQRKGIGFQRQQPRMGRGCGGKGARTPGHPSPPIQKARTAGRNKKTRVARSPPLAVQGGATTAFTAEPSQRLSLLPSPNADHARSLPPFRHITGEGEARTTRRHPFATMLSSHQAAALEA